jgi:TetR/AcrR family transcriptional regulator, transcriptional repressor for nem operon
MPRLSNLNRAEIVDKAMYFFWEHGFDGTSIDALVKALGTTRFSLYHLFNGKEGLYIAALDRYRDTIVTQALIVMNESDLGIDGIANYFEFLISNAQLNNCLSRGCLMANTMVEFGNLDIEVSAKVNHHFDRVTMTMCSVLAQVRKKDTDHLTIEHQAVYLATFAQGLWIRARAGADADTLRVACSAALAILKSI